MHTEKQRAEELSYMLMSRRVMNGMLMSRRVINGSHEKHSGTSSLQPEVLTNVTNLLGRVSKTAFLNFRYGRANRYNARKSVYVKHSHPTHLQGK
jgi:hypothetical protein